MESARARNLNGGGSGQWEIRANAQTVRPRCLQTNLPITITAKYVQLHGATEDLMAEALSLRAPCEVIASTRRFGAPRSDRSALIWDLDVAEWVRRSGGTICGDMQSTQLSSTLNNIQFDDLGDPERVTAPSGAIDQEGLG
jgi:hypothetical protein